MPADARIGAWLKAWTLAETAQKVINEHVGKAGVGAIHDTLLAQARIYTDLAVAPEDVGLAAGEYLAEEYKRKREQRERLDTMFSDLKESNDGRA